MRFANNADPNRWRTLPRSPSREFPDCPPEDAMNQTITKAALSPSRKRLVQMMQHLNYGRIEDLSIRGGEPIFDPPPRVIRHIKLGADNAPRPELAHADFALKSQIVELFDH